MKYCVASISILENPYLFHMTHILEHTQFKSASVYKKKKRKNLYDSKEAATNLTIVRNDEIIVYPNILLQYFKAVN